MCQAPTVTSVELSWLKWLNPFKLIGAFIDWLGGRVTSRQHLKETMDAQKELIDVFRAKEGDWEATQANMRKEMARLKDENESLKKEISQLQPVTIEVDVTNSMAREVINYLAANNDLSAYAIADHLNTQRVIAETAIDELLTTDPPLIYVHGFGGKNVPRYALTSEGCKFAARKGLTGKNCPRTLEY